MAEEEREASVRAARTQRNAAKLLVLAVMVIVFAAACAPGTEAYSSTEAGFFSGIWHGWIAPVSIIVHFFNNEVRVYETNNTGIWYDVGFYMAIISGFGSLGLRRRHTRKD